ncbi:WbqC family protein [Streptomyces katrae]|uniref:WbqC family protein n=1 Tax=Streptomyces katrae TaxID=68223 RepID=A0ABT7GX93_9ACTN|nr:WbqC family protein [Streptomyces katrae]MDK9498232.1 WbqC family protein [Streptomyces katrae]
MCAIHQPNFFPRLSTLAKLFAADVWVVLDDVQFARRDYQHRARLATLADLGDRRWLSLATHLPQGRSTLIRDARLADSARCLRRTQGLTRQLYGQSPYWPAVKQVVQRVLETISTTKSTAVVAEASTSLLLEVVGWPGSVVHSSSLAKRAGRSTRLVDLASATHSRTYLCGTGGMSYIDPRTFAAHGISVLPFQAPAISCPPWSEAKAISALWALATVGPERLRHELLAHASRTREAPRPAVAGSRFLAREAWGTGSMAQPSRARGATGRLRSP